MPGGVLRSEHSTCARFVCRRTSLSSVGERGFVHLRFCWRGGGGGRLAASAGCNAVRQWRCDLRGMWLCVVRICAMDVAAAFVIASVSMVGAPAEPWRAAAAAAHRQLAASAPRRSAKGAGLP